MTAPSKEVEHLLAEKHARLTYSDFPWTCSCDPCTSNAASTFSSHVAQVLDEAGLLAERTGRCCGCGDCEAPLHVHGCYADTGGCDDPTDHQPSAAPSECDDPLCGSEPHEHHGDAIKYPSKPAAAPSEDAATIPASGLQLTDDVASAHSEDVEALASALREAGVERGYVGGDVFRQKVAERLLASDWLAAHAAQVRADERQKVVALLADEGSVEKVAEAIVGGCGDVWNSDRADARAAIGVIAGLIGGEDE